MVSIQKRTSEYYDLSLLYSDHPHYPKPIGYLWNSFLFMNLEKIMKITSLKLLKTVFNSLLYTFYKWWWWLILCFVFGCTATLSASGNQPVSQQNILEFSQPLIIGGCSDLHFFHRCVNYCLDAQHNPVSFGLRQGWQHDRQSKIGFGWSRLYNLVYSGIYPEIRMFARKMEICQGPNECDRYENQCLWAASFMRRLLSSSSSSGTSSFWNVNNRCRLQKSRYHEFGHDIVFQVVLVFKRLHQNCQWIFHVSMIYRTTKRYGPIVEILNNGSNATYLYSEDQPNSWYVDFVGNT